MHRISALLVPLLFVVASCCQIINPSTSQPAPQHASQASYNYVIVHGAWGGGWAFRDVEAMLLADGSKVHRPTLTGQGERSHLNNPDINLSTHIQDIVNVILWDDMHDVVLVGHSYGGMVITGVADRIPERIKYMIYVDALLPENGESVDQIKGLSKANPLKTTVRDGYIIPTWLKPDAPLPHDVPMSEKTFSEPISLKNQDVARKIPTTFILTVDPGKTPEDDMFYPFYQRAKSRGWKVEIMEGDHNVQWSHPKELVKLLEEAP